MTKPAALAANYWRLFAATGVRIERKKTDSEDFGDPQPVIHNLDRAGFPIRRLDMKIHGLQLHGLRPVRHDKGVIAIGADVLVQPRDRQSRRR